MSFSSAREAEGFAVAHERELLLADSAADFAGAVLRLLRDQALRQRLRRAGRAFVEREYDWSAIAPRLEAVLKATAGYNSSGTVQGKPA